MDLTQLKEILDLFEKSSLSSLSLKEGSTEITLQRELFIQTQTTKINQKEEEEVLPLISGHQIKSPIVGTFYRAQSPDSSPLVQIGDQVQVGDVLCVIESMKMMNEIVSDVKGTITHIHLENQQMVEYDQPLFTIEL